MEEEEGERKARKEERAERVAEKENKGRETNIKFKMRRKEGQEGREACRALTRNSAGERNNITKQKENKG